MSEYQAVGISCHGVCY